jgi:hypothetical protein
MDLNDICYEHIKDTFHYGMFGDFKLVIDKNTGCFNATKLCDMTGREFKQWSRNTKSKKLIEYYTKSWEPNLAPNFYEIKGCNNSDYKLVTGQYLCKELLLDVSSWISIEFYDKCSKIINDYFISESKHANIIEIEGKMQSLKLENEAYEEQLKQKQDTIDELLELSKKQDKKLDHIQAQLDEIQDQNEVLIEQNCDLETKLESAVEDRVPKTASKSKLEQFILLKKNDPDQEFQYYVICGQRPYCVTRIRVMLRKYPKMTSILNLEYQPNTKNLFSRFKEKYSRKDCIVRMNDIKLEELTELDIIDAFEDLNDTKYHFKK